jgi:hypothetical protein
LLPNEEVELVNTQSSGRLEQTVRGLILRLKSTAFLNDPRMVETSRIISVEENSMHYTQSMYTTAVPGPAHHVEARLNRIS